MKYGYFDHTQRQISSDEWRSLTEDESYVTLKRFRDQRVHIEARWVGRVKDPQNHFPGMRPIFQMLMWNRNSAGEWVQDPNHGLTYANKAKLLQDYNDFLLEWTQTTLDENGEMLEVGNELEALPEAEAKVTKTTKLVGVDEAVSSVGVW